MKKSIATGDAKTAAAQRQALDKINRLASGGAPNKALQAAYDELMESVKDGNEKAIQKAIQTAVNERSRYVAERIARTEMARAYADGFVAKMNGDDDIVAVKFKLSGRHPTFDICDMYAKADMYNLGAGVYPKDKLPPLPVHPHCLCRYSEIYTGEVDTTKEKPRIREAGDKWLAGLTEYQRQKVLGVDGLKAWKAGKDRRKYMHGYAGFEEAKSRLTKLKVQVNTDYEKYKEILNGNMPSIEDFREIRYNKSEWRMFREYSAGIKSGDLTPLADFNLYKKIAQAVDKRLVGIITSNKIQITGKTSHSIYRIIGSIEQGRNGVEIGDIREALASKDAVKLPVKETKAGLSQKFRTSKLEVSVNPDTGIIIQVNPIHTRKKG